MKKAMDTNTIELALIVSSKLSLQFLANSVFSNAFRLTSWLHTAGLYTRIIPSNYFIIKVLDQS